MTLTRLAVAVVLSIAANRVGAESTLLVDDYRDLSLGMFSGGVVGALTEYHYLPAAAPKGNWVVSVFRTDGSQRAWRIIADDEQQRSFYQSYTAQPVERTYMHPMVIAGDELWTDYVLETSVTPEVDDGGIAGVAFRYRNDRRYLFAGVMGQKAIVKKVDQGLAFRKMNETVLAEGRLAWKAGERIDLRVQVAGERIVASVGGVKLQTRDATFPAGKVGFTSDAPARFGSIRVACSEETHARIQSAIVARQNQEDERVAAHPKMVLWKKFSLRNFGVGRNLRFGDLDGDGDIDILVAQQKRHGPGDGHSEVGCLTAVTTDGEILWQNGTADSWNYLLTNDVAVQVHDLDGDGKDEVVYCRDFEIVVADGASGKTKYKAPTPETPPDALGERRRWPRILGDAMAFADLRGTGHKRDILIKDRYRTLWAFNDKLEQLWMLRLNTGHYPFVHDVDGDGRDEIAVGYSLVSPDGKIIFSNEKQLQDHADGVAIVSLKEGAPKRLLTAASDEGFFVTDPLSGKILKHHQIGHAQCMSVADYRTDLPGLEIATVNFWGNQGIVHFFDAEGNPYHDCEPSQHGSMMLPVNWTGRVPELWALSPSSAHGGLFDGHGRRCVGFPADGHPEMCIAVLDLTGDCRDELVVWDPWEVWIYTQADGPKSGELYKPIRNPMCNTSNYQATVSLPPAHSDR